MPKWCPVRAIGFPNPPSICVNPEDMGKTGEEAVKYLQAVDRLVGCWGKKCTWYGHLCPGDEDIP